MRMILLFQMVQAIQVLRFHLLELEKVRYVFFSKFLQPNALHVAINRMENIVKKFISFANASVLMTVFLWYSIAVKFLFKLVVCKVQM